MQHLRSPLIAGLIAAVAWIVITLAVGGFSSAAVWGGGLAFFVGTAAVTHLISSMIRRSHQPH